MIRTEGIYFLRIYWWAIHYLAYYNATCQNYKRIITENIIWNNVIGNY